MKFEGRKTYMLLMIISKYFLQSDFSRLSSIARRMNKNKIDLRRGPRLHPNGLINDLKFLLYYGISDSIIVIQILYLTIRIRTFILLL